ncbi:MAG: 4-hydroxy-tetrahydrodipicolinate synthase [Pseudomonadota bacterium]
MKFACMVALVTPMHENGQVDYSALTVLLDWHLESGTEAIVILGTTGESPTLSHEERTAIIKATVTQVSHRIPIFVGTGTYDTRSTIELSQEAEMLGADGLLIINPYYNKPTQKGLFLHFKAVNDAVKIPIIIYNHPGRTGGCLDEETIHQLSQLKNILGLKEVSGDMKRIANIRATCSPSFLLWSGCDDNILDFIKAGGHGVISVTANIVPALMRQLTQYTLAQQWVEARNLQEKLMPLHDATCIETNPIPVKYALYLMKKIPIGIRLPLTVLEKNHQITLENVLRTFSL